MRFANVKKAVSDFLASSNKTSVAVHEDDIDFIAMGFTPEGIKYNREAFGSKREETSSMPLTPEALANAQKGGKAEKVMSRSLKSKSV